MWATITRKAGYADRAILSIAHPSPTEGIAAIHL